MAGTDKASKSCAPVGAGRSARNIRPSSSKAIFEISVGPAAGGTAISIRASAPKRAVRIEADRPDAQALRDRVIEPAVMDGEAEDASLRRGVAPGRRPGAVELRAADAGGGPGGRGRRKTDDRKPGEAVVVAAEIGAVQADAMDQPAFAVGDEQRFRRLVIGEAAQRGARVAPDVGEQRDAAIGAVDLPQGARPAAFAPLPRHEARVGPALADAFARPSFPGATIDSP